MSSTLKSPLSQKGKVQLACGALPAIMRRKYAKAWLWGISAKVKTAAVVGLDAREVEEARERVHLVSKQ